MNYSSNIHQLYKLADFKKYSLYVQSYIREHVIFNSSCLFLVNRNNTVRTAFPYNMPPGFLSDFQIFTKIFTDKIPSLTAKNNKSIAKFSIENNEDLYRTNSEKSVFLKYNTFYFVCLRIYNDKDLDGLLILCRQEQDVDFNKDDILILSQILPHIQTSCYNQYHYNLLNNEKTLLEQISSVKDKGVFVLDNVFKLFSFNLLASTIVPSFSQIHFNSVRELCSSYNQDYLKASSFNCTLELGNRTIPIYIKIILDKISNKTYYWCEFSPDYTSFGVKTRKALTPKERIILEHILTGKSNKGIATSLKVSPETIKSHIRNIYHKYNVHSRTELLSKILLTG